MNRRDFCKTSAVVTAAALLPIPALADHGYTVIQGYTRLHPPARRRVFVSGLVPGSHIAVYEDWHDFDVCASYLTADSDGRVRFTLLEDSAEAFYLHVTHPDRLSMYLRMRQCGPEPLDLTLQQPPIFRRGE